MSGEEVTLYEDDEGWGWVQLVRDGYVGYIAMAALAEGRSAPTHRAGNFLRLAKSAHRNERQDRFFQNLGRDRLHHIGRRYSRGKWC